MAKSRFPETGALQLAALSGDALGIENLKIVVGFIIYVSYQLAEMARKFDFSKAIQLAFFIGENREILSKGKAALAELKDVSQDEAQELVDYFGVNFDLADDTLEQRIESGLQFIPRGYTLLKRNIEFYSELKDWVKSWGETEAAAVQALPAKLKLAA
ncbi:MAG: hypothetical protein KDD02_09755 [Phaeodactylibacter sp.]|nr:hypothetical protein [Phaeodactylibacter sp.]MCB9302606.1 hypothetical protein [Lewinellaceae bacterium]